jgi:hypothetical protein
MTSKKVADFSLDPQQQTSEPLTRQYFRQAVHEVAERAKAKLPQAVNGRIDKATQIVLAGDVEFLSDGRAIVGSQSHTAMQYLVNGTCECPDAERPEIETWCKHKIAVCILKRAEPLARQKLYHALEAEKAKHSASLPEAPASVNCYIDVAGRKVQVTLRDEDEGRLLQRLETLLLRFPTDEKPQELPEGWCSIHQVQMTHHNNGKGSWWSHRLNDGHWCKGK